MSWKKRFTDNIADVLRFIGYAFLALDAIALAVFSFWFIAKFVYELSLWIDRVLFERWN